MTDLHLLAPDGWTLTFTPGTPAQIDVAGADGVKRCVISGDISDGRLRREVRRFVREHPTGSTINVS